MNPLLIPISIAFACGIIFTKYLSFPADLLAYGVLILLLVAICFTKKRRKLVIVIFFLLGSWRHLVVQVAEEPPTQLLPASLGVKGRVCAAPSERLNPRKNLRRTFCKIDVNSINSGQGWETRKFKIAALTEGTLDVFQGDAVELFGQAREPDPPIAPGVFDYREWLNSKGIKAEIHVKSTTDWKIIDRSFLGG